MPARLQVDARRASSLPPITPRVPGGLGSQAGVNNPALIPAGRTGTLKWSVGGAVGLILTPKQGNNKWSGIRTLHKTNFRPATSPGAFLTIPVFAPPACRYDQTD